MGAGNWVQERWPKITKTIGITITITITITIITIIMISKLPHLEERVRHAAADDDAYK